METNAALAALSALAQESRLAVFRLLVGAGPAGLAAGEVAEQLGVPPATLSFHLRMLVHANLLRSERQGRSIRYFARFDAMNGLIEYLTDHCCGGDPSACLSAAPRRAARKAKAR